jgi:hypothetical protein
MFQMMKITDDSRTHVINLPVVHQCQHVTLKCSKLKFGWPQEAPPAWSHTWHLHNAYYDARKQADCDMQLA